MPAKAGISSPGLRSAAAPLAPDRRASFIADVVATLQQQPPEMIGPGVVHRIIVATQRAHFDPPSFVGISAPRSRRAVR